LVVVLAGEPEPPIRAQAQVHASNRLDESHYPTQLPFGRRRNLHPVWGFAAPSSGLVRSVLVAIGLGACAGAVGTLVVLGRPLGEASISNNGAASASRTEATIGTQAGAATSQSFAVDPKAVRTERLKSQSLSAAAKNQNSSPATSSNPDVKRAEAQSAVSEPNSNNQPQCDVALCERRYHSFRASDCTYQPYSGPRQYCAR
jgi:hypothetical protein